MRGVQFLTAAVLASLAGACGNHGDDGHEWTAEELAELEHKWGMEVSLFFSVLSILDQNGGTEF